MNVQALEESLPQEDLQVCESYLRSQLGEALSADDLANLAAAQADPRLAGLLEQLGRTHAVLVRAGTLVRPSPGFVQRVMGALPTAGQDQPAQPQSRPRVAEPVRSFSSRRARRGWLSLAAAAAVVGLLLGGSWWFGVFPPGARSGVEGVLKGSEALRDAQGGPVTRLVSGKRYRTTGNTEVVLKVGSESLVRIPRQAEFEPQSGEQRRSIRLHGGSVIAYHPSQDRLEIACEAFRAEVQGTSLVHQDTPQRVERAAAEGERAADVVPGSGLVLVYRGDVVVRGKEGGAPLRVREGEVFVEGLEPEKVTEFLEATPDRVAQLRKFTGNTGGYRENRQLYSKVVDGYRQDLRKLEEQLAQAKDPAGISALRDSQGRISRYLETHLQKLKQLPEVAPGQLPEDRAGSLLRAVQTVEEHQEEEVKPEDWL